MAFTYTTQVAGWALTVEQFGDPGTVSQLYTVTRTSEIPSITLTLFYDDGATAYTTSVNPAGMSYSPAPVFVAPTSRLVARLLVVEDAGSTTVLDCVWTAATTGTNIIGLDDCLAYYSPSNIDGRGTVHSDGDVITWWRDLSGHERTQSFTGAVTYESAYWANGTPAVYFPDAAAGVYASPMQHAENWTAYTYTKRSSPVAATVEYLLNAGSQAGYLAVAWAGSVYRTAASYAYNTLGTEFLANSGPIDHTSEHLYCAVHDSGTLTVYLDGAQVATAALTGTGKSRADIGLAVNSALGGTGTEGWFGGVALFGVAHDATQRAVIGRGVAGFGDFVNLAPSPGGVLTASASPRGRVRIGMSVSPDGGPP